MAKRKFLVCFPVEGDIKKIDKIADALESEGIDFMQVDGETPSGEFVSVAQGDIDEVKEDIAEIPGFEGTMAGLDDLTIMPKDEDEDDDMELDDVVEEFVLRMYGPKGSNRAFDYDTYGSFKEKWLEEHPGDDNMYQDASKEFFNEKMQEIGMRLVEDNQLDDNFELNPTYLERDEEFVERLLEKREQSDKVSGTRVLVYIEGLDKWMEGTLKGFTEGGQPEIEIERSELYLLGDTGYDFALIDEDDPGAPDLNDEKGVNEWLKKMHGIYFDSIDSEYGTILIKPDFSYEDIRHPESDILNEDEIIATKEDKNEFGKGGGIGHWKKDEKIVQGSEIYDAKKKKTNDNSMLLGGFAGILLGIFLNR